MDDLDKGEGKKGKAKTVVRPGIKHVIAVMSGKGGVGKSTVTALLATGARRAGWRTGILDADITGPSIPRMFGLPVGRDKGDRRPAESKSGIKIVSINLFVAEEDNPVIWRGPLITSAIRQFWTQMEWGELDYLFLDLPPGTSDAPLTVIQLIPLDGLVVVSSPQELALMVVKKALKMAERLKIPVLGLVENMSGLSCPHCGREVEIFASGRAGEVAGQAGLPLLARLPLDRKLAWYCDRGLVEEYESDLFRKFSAAVAIK